MMQTIQDQITRLSGPDFRELKAWIITTETTRRTQEPAVRAGQQEIIKGLQEEGVIPAPEYDDLDKAKNPKATITKWIDPGTNHALMYPRGAVVMHHGRIYESGVDMNHWEPGAPGVYAVVWRDVTMQVRPPAPEVENEDGTTTTRPPAATMPLPYTDDRDYKAGELVIYAGAIWECTGDHRAATGWTPENAHAYWTKRD